MCIIVFTERFRQYDYGILKNFLMYKSFTPPDYNLSNVNMPLYIICANNDKLADKEVSTECKIK